MDISNLTPQQIAAIMAQLQAQPGQAAPPPPAPVAPPPQYPPAAPTFVPLGGAPQQAGYGMPHGMPQPQGAQLPPQGQPASADVITNLPPPNLLAGTYDFEVMFVERKSGVSDKGNAWEQLRYRFTVVAGPMQGQSIIDSLSTTYTRPLYALADAVGKPIQRDAAGNVAFNVRSFDGSRVCAVVSYEASKDGREYGRVGQFKPVAR
jgi:hypothetical protein